MGDEKNYGDALDRIERKLRDEIEKISNKNIDVAQRLAASESEIKHVSSMAEQQILSLGANIDDIRKKLEDGSKEFRVIDGMLTELGEILNGIKRSTDKVTEITIELTRQDERLKQLRIDFDKHLTHHENAEKRLFEKGKDMFGRVIGLVSLGITALSSIAAVIYFLIKGK